MLCRVVSIIDLKIAAILSRPCRGWSPVFIPPLVTCESLRRQGNPMQASFSIVCVSPTGGYRVATVNFLLMDQKVIAIRQPF